MDIVGVPIKIRDGSVVLPSVKHDEINEVAYLKSVTCGRSRADEPMEKDRQILRESSISICRRGIHSKYARTAFILR